MSCLIKASGCKIACSVLSRSPSNIPGTKEMLTSTAVDNPFLLSNIYKYVVMVIVLWIFLCHTMLSSSHDMADES